MNKKRLWIGEAPKNPSLDDTIWQRPAEGPSSLRTNLDPELKKLGAVPPLNRDLVWLSTAVFLADRLTRRPKGWRRKLQVTVPVSRVDKWSSVASDLEAILGFLTSDTWDVDFEATSLAESKLKAVKKPEVEFVSLFSGGADSMCGVLQLLSQGNRVGLVSHWDWSGHAGTQRQLLRELRGLFGDRVVSWQVQLGRGNSQIDGRRFPDEATRRSRSLLFLSLGLAAASQGTDSHLWIPENGFTSLNPPLAPERRGALSTRTTHPTFLAGVKKALKGVGAHADFENPYEQLTKGEMFKEVSGLIGPDQASDLLSKTHSCAHVRLAGSFGYPPSTHCGICFGCLVRRAAFLSSGLQDQTTYLVTELSKRTLAEFLKKPSVRGEVESVRYATARKVTPADILALDLPREHDLDQAFHLVQRGFDELKQVPLP